MEVGILNDAHDAVIDVDVIASSRQRFDVPTHLFGGLGTIGDDMDLGDPVLAMDDFRRRHPRELLQVPLELNRLSPAVSHCGSIRGLQDGLRYLSSVTCENAEPPDVTGVSCPLQGLSRVHIVTVLQHVLRGTVAGVIGAGNRRGGD